MSKLSPSRVPANGRLSRAGQGTDHSPTAIRRLRDASIRGMCSPEWGSELGRLWLEGKLTGRQYQAGKAFAELRHDYLDAIASPPEAPSVSIGEKASRGHTDGAREAARHRRAVKRYQDAIDVLGAQASIVLPTCEHDTLIVGASFGALSVGLTSLADHWGLPS